MKYRRLPASFILLIIFCFFGCGQGRVLENIDFEDTVSPEGRDLPQLPEINICVGSMITPQEGYVYYKELLDYIGKRLNAKVNFIEKKTYGEVNALLKNGNIDMAFVCGGPYVVGHDEFGLELLAAPVVGGKPLYYSYIIVARDSEVERMEDLEGKVFAFVDPMSNTGKLIPTYMLQELGKNAQSFFKECLYTYSHDSSIKAVAQQIVDGAAVDSLVWDYMDRKGSKYTDKTKIIKVSEPYGIPPVVVRPNFDQNLKVKLKKILLNMHVDPEGKLILERMSIDRFVEIEDSAYNTIREIKASIRE